MKRLAATFFLLSACLGAAACGPREIGEGMAMEEQASHEPPSAAEQMRLPMTGAGNTQRMLYYYNRPDVMENTQNWRMSRLRRKLGVQPAPEDPAYRAVPRQRSPFRQ